MKNVLIVGSGAREVALARSVSKSLVENSIFCVSKDINPQIVNLCKDYFVTDLTNISDIVSYSRKNKVDFAIIGPENPLEAGVSDDLWQCGIKVVGPKKKLAQIETSKSFTRDLFKKYQIPGCPKYQTFETIEGVSEFFNELENNYVVKFDGLAGGKGVKVSGEHLHNMSEASAYCQEIIDKGGKFVIEEKFIGEEFSLMSFCDGKSLKHMPIVQDHKRAYENDTGPNTGGMGTYTDINHSLPFLTIEDVNQAKEMNKATINALAKKFNESYKGILYGGFIATADGVKLIEYNARLGDPEAMNVLSLIETDFIDICYAITDGTLDKINVQFNKQATVCKYVVPEGYPENPVKGEPVDISNVDNLDNLYYASVDIHNEKLIECGSRTIAIVGIANSISLAETMAEKEAASIKGPLFHRQDIGKDFLIQKRVDNMKLLR